MRPGTNYTPVHRAWATLTFEAAGLSYAAGKKYSTCPAPTINAAVEGISVDISTTEKRCTFFPNARRKDHETLHQLQRMRGIPMIRRSRPRFAAVGGRVGRETRVHSRNTSNRFQSQPPKTREKESSPLPCLLLLLLISLDIEPGENITILILWSVKVQLLSQAFFWGDPAPLNPIPAASPPHCWLSNNVLKKFSSSCPKV